MKLTPKQLATLWRFAKVVACEAGAVAIATALSFLQGNGGALGLSNASLALVIAMVTPAAAAAEKWLHWVEAQPVK